MAKKIDHYLAVPDDGDVASQAWDMLRYDSCYPVSNPPKGWVIFKQPHHDGVRGGFTVARWTSFGFRKIIVGTQLQTIYGLPEEMLRQIYAADKAKS